MLILLLLHIVIEDRPRRIKDKEKLKNDKYSQRCQLIDSDFTLIHMLKYDKYSQRCQMIDFDYACSLGNL